MSYVTYINMLLKMDDLYQQLTYMSMGRLTTG